jgi:transposase-like protein
MNVHKNAPLTPKGGEAMVRSVVEGGLSQADAAHQFNTTPKTVAKWVKRFRKEGVEGLRDRSSRPHSSPSQTPPATCAAVEALRRQRHTSKQIARRGRGVTGHCQSHSSPLGVKPDTRSGAGRTGAPLRARASR